MYPSSSPSSSSLQQHQPQRYSDRHQLQRSGSGVLQPPKSTDEKNRQNGESGCDGTPDYQQGIKVNLKKSDAVLDLRAAKPDTPE